jgi:hypothetical protein
VPAGGAKVLDGIGKELQLDEAAMEPSRMVLHDYGNVSSSTTWYTLGYVESVRGAKKGECCWTRWGVCPASNSKLLVPYNLRMNDASGCGLSGCFCIYKEFWACRSGIFHLSLTCGCCVCVLHSRR